ncbi:MAG: hypothetical protein ABSC29_00570 [Minisyncoccia bacterium]|jgi:hypothetical protein
MKTIKKLLYGRSFPGAGIAGILTVFFAAGSVSAATMPTNILTNSDQVVAIFCVALDWMFWGLMVLAVVMFLVGGYIYATSGGSSEKVGQATKTLTYAAIAVVVALAARGVPILIGSFLGVSSGQLSACS